MIPENGRLAMVHVNDLQYSELEKGKTIYTEDTSIYDLERLDVVAASADNGYHYTVCKILSCRAIENRLAYALELQKR